LKTYVEFDTQLPTDIKQSVTIAISYG